MVRNQQSGFVLVASMWLLLVMLLGAGVFDRYVNAQLQSAISMKRKFQDDLDRLATEQTLLYVLATNGMSRRGLKVEDSGSHYFLKLDGTFYQGLGEVVFSLNDYAGLVGVNAYSNVHLDNLLKSFGADASERQNLLDSLYDYIDMDDFSRLRGNEVGAPNEFLHTPEELREVSGWSAWIDGFPDFDIRWLSSNWRSRFNLNTAPEVLLRRVLPVSPEEADRLVKYRRAQPFTNIDTVTKLLHYRVSLIDDYYTFIPTGDVRVSIKSTGNSKTNVMDLISTPMSVRAPSWINYRYTYEDKSNSSSVIQPVRGGYFKRQFSSAEK